MYKNSMRPVAGSAKTGQAEVTDSAKNPGRPALVIAHKITDCRPFLIMYGKWAHVLPLVDAAVVLIMLIQRVVMKCHCYMLHLINYHCLWYLANNRQSRGFFAIDISMHMYDATIGTKTQMRCKIWSKKWYKYRQTDQNRQVMRYVVGIWRD